MLLYIYAYDFTIDRLKQKSLLNLDESLLMNYAIINSFGRSESALFWFGVVLFFNTSSGSKFQYDLLLDERIYFKYT